MLFNLIRPINVFFGMISVLVISPTLDNINIYFTIIVVSSFIAISNIINDLFDQKTDKINGRQKILKSKILYVYFLLIFLLFIGIFSVFKLNFYSQIITLIFVLPLIFLYTPIFKGIPILGNVIVSILVANVFIFTEISIYQKIKFSLLPFFFAFITTLIREIIKDLEDVKGDKENHITTFPVLYGEYKARVICLFLMLFLNIIVLIPYFLGFYNMIYLLTVIIGVILPNSYCIKYIIKNRYKYNYRFIQNFQKKITFIGLIIIYLMKNNF